MSSSRVGTLAWAERTGGILSRGERIGLLGDAVRLQMRILPAQTRTLLGRTNRRAFSVDPNRLSVPDTMIAREAEALSSEVYPPALLNHCLRSYAWGTILAQRDGLEHDPELFYVTCLLHDLGVTDRYRDTVAGQSCFAATAATVARDWSRGHGWREPRCTALADAICQHLNPQVRPEHGTEAHLIQAGARRWSSGAGGRWSLVKMLATCFSTARPEITRPSAIAWLLRPSAISPSTSCSRGVSSSSGSSARRRPSMCETTSGSSAEPPSATRWTASMKRSTSATRSFSR